MEEVINSRIVKTKITPIQITLMEYIEKVNKQKEMVLSFLKNLNVYTSNPNYEITNVEVGEDWKIKKIHLKLKKSSNWILLEIIINNYDYSLDTNSAHETDDETFVARLKWKIDFTPKSKELEGYIKEILKQFHEIKGQ